MQTTRRIELKITPTIKKEIVKIIDERIREAHVTKEDFSELKGIVKELGVKVGELADAQKRTENRVAELAEAQKRTEVTVAELADEMKVLARGLDMNREETGGLSRSFSYAFENEAYRMLPMALKEKYGIEIKEKIIRADIGGKEINIFGHAEKEGKRKGEKKMYLKNWKRKLNPYVRSIEKLK